MKLFKPRMMSRSIGQHFFSFRVIQQWNDLPQEVVLAKKNSSFKYLLDKYWKETVHGHCQRSPAYKIILNFYCPFLRYKLVKNHQLSFFIFSYFLLPFAHLQKNCHKTRTRNPIVLNLVHMRRDTWHIFKPNLVQIQASVAEL